MTCFCWPSNSKHRGSDYTTVKRELSRTFSVNASPDFGSPLSQPDAEDPLETHHLQNLSVDEECPCVIERQDKDRLLCQRMSWNFGIPAIRATIIAVSKFKRMAIRARETVAKRNADGSSVARVPDVQANENEDGVIAEQSLLSREDKIQEGIKLLNERLRFLRLASTQMIDDGNCQFRAFSLELFGTQDHHEHVRATAAKWLAEHSADFSTYIGGEDEWENYLRDMSASKTWGDELSLRAVCDAYGIVTHLITTEKDNWHAVYEPAEPKPPFRHVFLAYISPIHYNTVEPL